MVATVWGLSASATQLRAFGYTTTNLREHLFNPSGKHSADQDAPGKEDVDRPPSFSWADAVAPFFPVWRDFLGEPDAGEPFRGSVTRKVSLGPDIWRRTVMPAESSFEDLAQFILHTFRFDDEHLYQFRYPDECATWRTLDDPRCSNVDDDYADDVTLGEAGLSPRQRLEFRYDFADDWRFEVRVEKLDGSGTSAKPALLAREGKAP